MFEGEGWGGAWRGFERPGVRRLISQTCFLSSSCSSRFGGGRAEQRFCGSVVEKAACHTYYYYYYYYCHYYYYLLHEQQLQLHIRRRGGEA